ncbi:unnamed protein product [Caenorhabditis bovis]|uniref:MARVEL domain-containing protein n=1 Tax=Caenorhabditis bovis TaxID=2654633 RepID=A0A8S1EKG4_9PELO|nr:unnamed protein product [Caenorhabditis bovis]
MFHHDGPPMMLNKGFFHESGNILKLFEIVFGLLAAVFNSLCYPNEDIQHCSVTLFSSFQLFQIMVVNLFCAFFTTLITVAIAFGVYDAYYRYNFPILERMLTTLFALLYLLATSISVIEVAATHVIPVFLFPLAFTVITFLAYAYDAHLQWKNRDKHIRY